jgi:putative transcriptional regulator
MGKAKQKKRSRVASEALEGLAELRDAVESGVPLDQKFTVRTVELDLKPREIRPEEIKILRHHLGASQAVFAAVLGVSTDAVQSWEQGRRPPGHTALRMMHMFKHHPKLFVQQIHLRSERQTA